MGTAPAVQTGAVAAGDPIDLWHGRLFLFMPNERIQREYGRKKDKVNSSKSN